jgi:predicted ATPase/DNA-binding SARP family transcriptional activator
LHNLPYCPTTFIGREREVEAVTEQLRAARLLTMTGPGGSGKTRLTLEIARRLTDFADGIWWCDLAAVADPAYVPETVATILGLTGAPNRVALDSLTERLRGWQALLVLDNCEHLLQSCAALAHAVLRGSPGVKILATSLQPLGLPQERVYVLPPLSLPPDAHKLAQSDAARLFLERAREAFAGFTLGPESASAVATICSRLDGMPLAIELAAARARLLSAEQIAQRLDNVLGLLTRGSTSKLPRHQTLRATMDWSYGLLTEPEQLLLRRLSVIAGSFSVDMVEAVCGDGLAARSVLDLLFDLADKSLILVHEPAAQGGARIRLLETVRQYSREKLESSGEAARILARLLEWAVALCEQAEPDLKGSDAIAWTARLQLNLDNIRATLRSVRQTQRPDLGLRLAGSLWRFWQRSGYIAEGYAWCQELLDLDEELRRQGAPAATPTQRAWALHTAGRMAVRRRDLAGEHYAQASLELFKQVGDRRGEANAFELETRFKLVQTSEYSVRDLTQQALALFREVGDDPGISRTLNNLGVAAFDEGNYRDAQRYFEESLATERQLDARPGLQIANLADVLKVRGDDARAQELFEESLSLAREIGEVIQQAGSLGYLAEIALNQRDFARAERSEPHFVSELTTKLDFAALHQGSVDRAVALFEDGLRLGHHPLGEFEMGYAQNGLGLVDRAAGRLEPAAARFQEALANFQRTERRLDVISAVENLAVVFARQGQTERPLRLLAAAQAQRERMGARVPPLDAGRLDETMKHLRSQLGSAAEGPLSAAQPLAFDQVLAELLVADLGPVQSAASAGRASRPAAPVSHLRLLALGPARVLVGERALTLADWRYAKSKEMLFYLLSHSPASKAQIGLDLWPDASPEQLRNIFHRALHELRRALGRPDWITFNGDEYAFNRARPFEYDVQAFDAHVAQAQVEMRSGAAGHAPAIEHLEAAAQLWRGDFLADLEAGEWAVIRREALRQSFLDALLQLGRLFFAEARNIAAAEIYGRVLNLDPYLETAHRELMRCHARRGETGRAVQQYRALQELLQKELNAEPSPETVLLYERLRRGDNV